PLQPRGFLRETAGYGALQEGDTERALEWLSEAERLVPDSPRVNLIRAFVLERMQSYARARLEVGRALELTAPKGFAQALETQATIALHQRDYAGAIEAYSRLADDFENGVALFRRAQLQWQLKRPARARADLERVRDAFPQIWKQLEANAKVKAWCAQVLQAK
ncbi:MAG: tetratricopeptide repeat protein, partial [Planctomycetes bacterium]|nr:tetratricopeptide repeat protein [Planctomycetota bacterium]